MNNNSPYVLTIPNESRQLRATRVQHARPFLPPARLYEDVETRSHELAKSLEDLRTTRDRLVQTQKLASLGQLTAGIAHEIKNLHSAAGASPALGRGPR
jgi:C4-dicarboxylate-specific signal transduction histidine kinase